MIRFFLHAPMDEAGSTVRLAQIYSYTSILWLGIIIKKRCMIKFVLVFLYPLVQYRVESYLLDTLTMWCDIVVNLNTNTSSAGFWLQFEVMLSCFWIKNKIQFEVEGAWTAWSSWSSGLTDSYRQTRYRSCKYSNPHCKGKQCYGNGEESRTVHRESQPNYQSKISVELILSKNCFHWYQTSPIIIDSYLKLWL